MKGEGVEGADLGILRSYLGGGVDMTDGGYRFWLGEGSGSE